jgi:hypothetical protein
MIRQGRSLALFTALVVGASGSALAQGYARPADYETLPEGTVLKARLNQGLSSAEARVGDRFTATVLSDEDRSGLPTGTRVVGVVREVKTATKEKPGVLDVEFTTLQFPDGASRSVRGSLTGLDNKSVERTESGRLVARKTSQKNDRVKFLGYGAGAGAVIGLLTGGNLLKSALLGAAGGFLYSELNKDKEKTGRYSDVNLKQGAEFGVRLDQPFGWHGVAVRNEVGDREPVGRLAGVPPMPPQSSAPAARPAGIGVLLDDREVSFERVQPTRIGKVLLVPVAPVLKAAGRRYTYNSQTRQLNVAGVQGAVQTTLGSAIATAGGRRVRLSAPARFLQGSLYVPVQILELSLGRRAEWDESSQTLLLMASDARLDRYQMRGARL